MRKCIILKWYYLLLLLEKSICVFVHCLYVLFTMWTKYLMTGIFSMSVISWIRGVLSAPVVMNTLLSHHIFCHYECYKIAVPPPKICIHRPYLYFVNSSQQLNQCCKNVTTHSTHITCHLASLLLMSMWSDSGTPSTNDSPFPLGSSFVGKYFSSRSPSVALENCCIDKVKQNHRVFLKN